MDYSQQVQPIQDWQILRKEFMSRAKACGHTFPDEMYENCSVCGALTTKELLMQCPIPESLSLIE